MQLTKILAAVLGSVVTKVQSFQCDQYRPFLDTAWDASKMIGKYSTMSVVNGNTLMYDAHGTAI